MELKETLECSSAPDGPPPSYNPSYPVLNQINHFKTLPPIGSNPISMLHQQQQQQQQPQQQQIPQPMVFIAGNLPVGPQPTIISCQHCGTKTLTRVEYKTAMRTHIIAALLCITGCVCLVPIPYFIKSCKNTNHYCHGCGQYLGTYNRNN